MLNGLKGVNKSLDFSWLDDSHNALKNKNSNALGCKKNWRSY